ncbi:MAG: pilus assembly protein N-terminal domain-containing protein, partial [Pseudomonas sp.]
MIRFCLLLLTLTSFFCSAQDIANGVQGSINLASGEGRILHFVAPVESVLVAEPGIADLQVVSPGVIYIFGKAPGNTSLIALGSDGKQLASLSLAVSSATQAVTAPMQELHPGNGAQISGAGNRLIAKGTVRSVGEATDLNALLNPQGQGFQSAVNTTEYAGAAQVNLRVRFAEVSRSELLHYGVNWNAMFSNGTFSFGLITGGPLAAATAGGLAAAGSGSGNTNIDGMLDALQANGILQILAEPN